MVRCFCNSVSVPFLLNESDGGPHVTSVFPWCRITYHLRSLAYLARRVALSAWPNGLDYSTRESISSWMAEQSRAESRRRGQRSARRKTGRGRAEQIIAVPHPLYRFLFSVSIDQRKGSLNDSSSMASCQRVLHIPHCLLSLIY